MSVNLARIGLKAILSTRLNRHRDSTNPAQSAGVGGVIGIKVERFLAKRAGGKVARKQRGLPPRCDHYILGLGWNACARLHPRGHFGTQFCNARDRCVSRMTTARGDIHRCQNTWIRANVVLANRQLCHRRPVCDHFARAHEDFPAVRSAFNQVGQCGGQNRHGDLLKRDVPLGQGMQDSSTLWTNAISVAMQLQ